MKNDHLSAFRLYLHWTGGLNRPYKGLSSCCNVSVKYPSGFLIFRFPQSLQMKELQTISLQLRRIDHGSCLQSICSDSRTNQACQRMPPACGSVCWIPTNRSKMMRQVSTGVLIRYLLEPRRAADGFDFWNIHMQKESLCRKEVWNSRRFLWQRKRCGKKVFSAGVFLSLCCIILLIISIKLL